MQTFTAITSGIGAMATGAAAVVAFWIWRSDRKRQDRNRARRVGASLDVIYALAPAKGHPVPVGEVRFANGSDLPVYELTAYVARSIEDLEGIEVRTKVLRPGQEHTASVHFRPDDAPTSGPLGIDFVLDDRKWYLNPDGHLSGGRVRKLTPDDWGC